MVDEMLFFLALYAHTVYDVDVDKCFNIRMKSLTCVILL